jgi:hypothetical protein
VRLPDAIFLLLTLAGGPALAQVSVSNDSMTAEQLANSSQYFTCGCFCTYECYGASFVPSQPLTVNYIYFLYGASSTVNTFVDIDILEGPSSVDPGELIDDGFGETRLEFLPLQFSSSQFLEIPVAAAGVVPPVIDAGEEFSLTLCFSYDEEAGADLLQPGDGHGPVLDQDGIQGSNWIRAWAPSVDEVLAGDTCGAETSTYTWRHNPGLSGDFVLRASDQPIDWLNPTGDDDDAVDDDDTVVDDDDTVVDDDDTVVDDDDAVDDDDTVPDDDDAVDDDDTADDDDSGANGSVRPPGCGVSCGAAGVGGSGLGLLLLLPLGLRRRRTSATAAVLLLALSPGLAFADGAKELAQQASDVHTEWCSEVAQSDYTRAAEAIGHVTPVWIEVSRQFDETGTPYLRFWRATLGRCIGQDARAEEELLAFIDASDGDQGLVSLVKQARRQLRLMGADVPAPRKTAARRTRAVSGSRGDVEPWPDAPRVLIAIAGGYRRLDAFDYGTVDLGLAVRLVGPLHLDGAARGGIGDLWRGTDGQPLVPTSRSLLFGGRAGVLLQFHGKVEPRVGVSVVVSGNQDGSVGPPVLVGPLVHGGVDIPLGASPVAFRISGEAGYLAPLPTAGVSGGIVLRI